MNKPSSLDEKRIRAMIYQAESRSKLHKKSYKYEADWLVDGTIGSEQWIVSFPDTPDVLKIEFNRVMPDGSSLTDQSNRIILCTIQKWLFHCRMGNITGKFASHQHWLGLLGFSFNLASRIILYKHIYNPEAHGFMLMDEDACKTLIDDLSAGSWAKALNFKERFLEHLISVLPITPEQTLKDVFSDPDHLPEDFTRAVIDYFTENDLYLTRWRASKRHNDSLSTKYVASVLGIHQAGVMNNVNFRCFLKQFERTSTHASLLQPSSRGKLHPSQNTPTTEYASMNTLGLQSLQLAIDNLRAFFNSNGILPNDIPKITLNTKKIISEYSSRMRPAGHTKLIPMEIGFECLNHACRWIMIYGKAIIASLTFYVPRFLDIDSAGHRHRTSNKLKIKLFNETRHQWITEEVDGLPAQRLDEALDIIKLHVGTRHGQLESESNYYSVIRSFIGACAIVIGMLKPIRAAELGKLNRNCLYYDEHLGGAFLRHSAGKTGELGINSEIDRPIPFVAAYAIQLLQILGNHLSKSYNDDSIHADRLFYFPTRAFKRPGTKRTAIKVSNCIDSFCDAISIPLGNLRTSLQLCENPRNT